MVRRLGYHGHDVVDGGKARIVLATLVTPAAVMENLPVLGLPWRRILPDRCGSIRWARGRQPSPAAAVANLVIKWLT